MKIINGTEIYFQTNNAGTIRFALLSNAIPGISIDNFSKVINEEKGGSGGGGRSPEIKDGLNNNSLTVQDSSK